MLVLSRQRDEIIRIGDHISVHIVDIRGDKVRLGVTAPPEIPIHRDEVYRAIKRERQQEVGDSPLPHLMRKYGEQAEPPSEFVQVMSLRQESYEFCAVAWTLFKERRRVISRDEIMERLRASA